MDAVKTVRLPPALHALMKGQVALASRLRKEEGLCGPCSTRISVRRALPDKRSDADCAKTARPATTTTTNREVTAPWHDQHQRN